MDFHAVKIILAAFLLIAFVAPFFRLSVSMPKKAKEERITTIKSTMSGVAAFQSATFALADARHRPDSTTVRVSDIRK